MNEPSAKDHTDSSPYEAGASCPSCGEPWLRPTQLPGRYRCVYCLVQFVDAGADSITIQVESTPNVHYALMQIRDGGCMAGLAINPATPVEAVAELTDSVDFVLCMTVNPGWGGQDFIDRSPGKVERL